MKSILKKIVQKLAWQNKRYMSLYLRFCRPSGTEYANYIKHHNYFFSMGEKCSIIPGTYLGDAKYIRIGNNVRLANCLLFAHDGVVNMLNQAYNLKLDAVGEIEIGDNVFVGHDAKVMRGVHIGSNCVIAAGAIVVKNVPSNSVVGGIPAKHLCSTDELVNRFKKESEALPWHSIIKQRKSEFDPIVEIELDKLRLAYFFNSKNEELALSD